MKGKIIILLLLLFIFYGCNNHISPTADDINIIPTVTPISNTTNQNTPQAVCTPGDVSYRFVNLSNCSYNGSLIKISNNIDGFIISSLDEFNNSFACTTTVLPPVDFSKEILAGIFYRMPCQPWSVEITGVTTDCKEVSVNINEIQPCGMCLTVYTEGYYYIVIDKTTCPINFNLEVNKCVTPGFTPITTPTPEPTCITGKLNFEPISMNLLNCFSGCIVIRTQEEYEELIFAGVLFSTDVIDFNQKMIIGISMGMKLTGGYYVTITDVEIDCDNNVVIKYSEKSPCPGEVVTQVVTCPYTFITVDKSDAPVIFSGSEVPCN